MLSGSCVHGVTVAFRVVCAWSDCCFQGCVFAWSDCCFQGRVCME